MFGIGGGSVRIPLLNLAGLPLVNAFAINLVAIPFSSTVGSIIHRKNICWEYVPYVMLGGIVGSVCGAFLVGLISNLVLAIIFVGVSIFTVTGIYFDKILPKLKDKLNLSPFPICTGTFILNFITGMRGGSGGSLFPPFLNMLGLDIRKAIATWLFTTIFTAVAGMMIYWRRGDIHWVQAFIVIAGSLIGAWLGSKLSLKSKPGWLKLGLSIFVVLLALMTLLKALVG